MATVSVRYIVEYVDDAVAFYCQHLGFKELMHPAATFAMLSRDDLRLVPSAQGGGGVRWSRQGTPPLVAMIGTAAKVRSNARAEP